MQIKSSTNKIKEIKLTSSIEQVSWTKTRATAGGKDRNRCFYKVCWQQLRHKN